MKLVYVNTLHYVEEMMITAGQVVRPIPEAATIEERKLRLALIFEELAELADAYGLNRTFLDLIQNHQVKTFMKVNEDTNIVNKKEVLDAHTDLRVVCDGGVLQDGLGEVFPTSFLRVHASNMSKFPEEEQVAKDTVAKYEAEGIPAYYVESNGRFVIRRQDNNKFLKALTYHKPELSDLVE